MIEAGCHHAIRIRQHPWQRCMHTPTHKLAKIQENKYIYSEIVCSFVYLFHLTAQHSPTSHLPPPLPIDTWPSSSFHNRNITHSTTAATTTPQLRHCTWHNGCDTPCNTTCGAKTATRHCTLHKDGNSDTPHSTTTATMTPYMAQQPQPRHPTW